MGDVALEGFGAGGAALNFKVVPGLTQPGTASENTIWVKTESLTGWYFSATQPENMAEGEVWFQTGTESAVEFNALKKNNLAVYPLSAKQMISGVLVDVEAMSYQGGEWVGWINDLFNNGNTFDYITGGWAIGGTIEGGYLCLDASQSGVTSAYAKKKIDVTRYNTMIVTVVKTSASGVNSNVKFGLANTGSTSSDTNYAATGVVKPPAAGTYELDISNMSGEYYVTVSAYASTAGTRISRVALKT